MCHPVTCVLSKGDSGPNCPVSFTSILRKVPHVAVKDSNKMNFHTIVWYHNTVNYIATYFQPVSKSTRSLNFPQLGQANHSERSTFPSALQHEEKPGYPQFNPFG